MLEHEAFAIAIINPFTFQVLLFLLLVRFGSIHTAVLHFFLVYFTYHSHFFTRFLLLLTISSLKTQLNSIRQSSWVG